MQGSSLLTCLWPGLPRLWWRGDWRGLLTAIGFAAALNLGLVTSFLWPQSLPSSVVVGGWVAILVFWLTSAWQGRRHLPEVCGTAGSPKNEDLFLRAQGEYLKGHWYEAETLCRQLLQQSEGDVETRLMLATLCRRTGRIEDASRELAKLEQMDGADKWALETARERRLLERAEAETLDSDQADGHDGILSV
jgi:hypothetical protein